MDNIVVLHRNKEISISDYLSFYRAKIDTGSLLSTTQIILSTQLSVTRTELYNFLKKEFISKDVHPEIITIEKGLLQLTIIEDIKVYYIGSTSKTGEFSDTFGLRDWILTIPNYTNTSFTNKPKYIRNKGWMYVKNPKNLNQLNKLKYAIHKTNTTYLNYIIINEEAPCKQLTDNLTTTISSGIIGWDIPYEDPQWLIDIVGTTTDKLGHWDVKYNPSINLDQITFSKCAIDNRVTEKALKFMRTKSKNGEKVWTGLFPKTVHFPGGESLLKEFLTDIKYTTIYLSWGKHARFGYKNYLKYSKELLIYDPWKQIATGQQWLSIVNESNKYEYTTKFTKRQIIDQGHEGSCALISLMRAIMMSEFGIIGATMKVPYEYAILTQRIISMKR